MGLLSFHKKSKKNNTAGDSSSLSQIKGPDTSSTTGTAMNASIDQKRKWTPIRRRATTTTPAPTKQSSAATPTTMLSTEEPPAPSHLTTTTTTAGVSLSSSTVLGNLSVMALDDVEVMTFESQRAMMDQREAIRKKLFDQSIHHLAESASVDEDDEDNNGNNNHINNGQNILRAHTDPARNNNNNLLPNLAENELPPTPGSPSDRFSLPLASVTRSWSGSLQKIAEEPVDYQLHHHQTHQTPYRRHQSAGPVSVDISYTESELDSVRTGYQHHQKTPSPRVLPNIITNNNTAVAQLGSTQNQVETLTIVTPAATSPRIVYSGSSGGGSSHSSNNNKIIRTTASSDSYFRAAIPLGANTPEEEYVSESVETSFTEAPSPDRNSNNNNSFVRSQFDRLRAAVSPGAVAVANLGTVVISSYHHPSSNANYDNNVNNNACFSAKTPSDIVTNLDEPFAAATESNSSIIPTGELEMDEVLDDDRTKEMTPFKGMPDDERMEYQKDEMIPSPEFATILQVQQFLLDQDSSAAIPDNATPLNQTTDCNTNSPLFWMQETKDGQSLSTPASVEHTSQSMGTSGGTTTSFTTSHGDSTRTPNMVPELARSILMAAFQCGSGALDNASSSIQACGVGDRISDFVGRAESGVESRDILSGVVENDSNNNSASSQDNAMLNPAKRRVYLDEASTARFLRRIVNNGFVLLYLQQPNEDEDDESASSDNVPVDDWKGRTVTMVINKGHFWNRPKKDTSSKNVRGLVDNQSPCLEWTTVTGGKSTDVVTTSVDLLDIQSILTNDEDKEEDEDLCFFTVTDGNGHVHIFEAATLEERNRIVNGLKTIVARWSFHLIAGDTAATSELYSSHASSQNLDVDMPSLPNPSLTMNRVAHIFLDSGPL